MTSDQERPDIPDEFWQTIEIARASTLRYRNLLKKMEPRQLVDFYWVYESASAWLKDERYVDYMSPKLSEDGIDDLAQWVVEQGKDYYERVLSHPEEVPRRAPERSKVLGEVVREYKRRFNDDIPFP
jgi:hypothetical protein